MNEKLEVLFRLCGIACLAIGLFHRDTFYISLAATSFVIANSPRGDA